VADFFEEKAFCPCSLAPFLCFSAGCSKTSSSAPPKEGPIVEEPRAGEVSEPAARKAQIT